MGVRLLITAIVSIVRVLTVHSTRIDRPYLQLTLTCITTSLLFCILLLYRLDSRDDFR